MNIFVWSDVLPLLALPKECEFDVPGFLPERFVIELELPEFDDDEEELDEYEELLWIGLGLEPEFDDDDELLLLLLLLL